MNILFIVIGIIIGIAILAAVIFLVIKRQDEPSQAQRESAVNGAKTDVKAKVGAVKDALKNLKEEILGSGELSYEEAMKYFIDHKNDSPNIAKGAIYKEEVKDGFLITQVFLDKNNKPVTDGHGKPLGYKRRVSRLNNELLHLFKDENLIMVE